MIMKFMQALLQSLSTLAFISSSLGCWKCTGLLFPGRDGEGWPWKMDRYRTNAGTEAAESSS